MSTKELSRRYTAERTPGTPLEGRVCEYTMNKIDLAIEMIRRAVSHKVKFRYVLADSWFTCAIVVKFIYGGLFRAANQDSPEITISERIWGVILELVAATTRVFNITDEEVLEAVVNESDELAHICELYRYKMAS